MEVKCVPGSLLDRRQIDEIETFMKENARLSNGNSSIPSIQMISNYNSSVWVLVIEENPLNTSNMEQLDRGLPTSPSMFNLSSYLVEDTNPIGGKDSLHSKRGKIIGCLVLLPFRLGNRRVSYVTSLCTDRNLRGKGISHLLTTKALNFLEHEMDIKETYYLTLNPHHTCHSLVHTWYRPINISLCRKAGFSLPRSYETQISAPRGCAIIYLTSELVLSSNVYNHLFPSEDTHKEFTDRHFIPNRAGLANYVTAFPSYLVGIKGPVVKYCLFSLVPFTSIVGSQEFVIKAANLALHLCSKEETPILLEAALYKAYQEGFDLLTGLISGSVGREIESIKGIVATDKVYIEFNGIEDSPWMPSSIVAPFI